MTKYIVYVLGILLITGCTKKESEQEVIPKDPATNAAAISPNDIPEPKKLSDQEILKNLNGEILQALKSKNYEKLSTFIHPEKGVRFSMYAYIRPESDKHFSREDFLKYIDSPTKFTWGERDGSGEKLVISVKQYLETWVFKKDFTHSEYYLNEFKGTGNSLNNLRTMYPQAAFTENYLPGTEKYAFMDWNSVRLVFEKHQGEYYLTAVVNDEWTI